MTSATDNRTTELLRKLLEERSVKWWEGEDERKTHWVANGLTWEYFNNENGDAWLGFLSACENDISPEQAIAATLGSGTLTAEQVRKVLADELNSRAERTCRNLDKHYNIMFKCSECGHWECQDFDGEKILPQTWNYCPNCGRRVRGGK